MAFIAPLILSQNHVLKCVVLVPQPYSYKNKVLSPSVIITLLCCYLMLSAQSLGCFWVCSGLSQPGSLFLTLFSHPGPRHGTVSVLQSHPPRSWHTQPCPRAFLSSNGNSQPCSEAVWVLNSPSPSSAGRRFLLFAQVAMGQVGVI